jgi:hypothetical protein
VIHTISDYQVSSVIHTYYLYTRYQIIKHQVWYTHIIFTHNIRLSSIKCDAHILSLHTISDYQASSVIHTYYFYTRYDIRLSSIKCDTHILSLHAISDYQVSSVIHTLSLHTISDYQVSSVIHTLSLHTISDYQASSVIHTYYHTRYQIIKHQVWYTHIITHDIRLLSIKCDTHILFLHTISDYQASSVIHTYYHTISNYQVSSEIHTYYHTRYQIIKHQVWYTQDIRLSSIKCDTYRLIHGLFHIAHVISLRPWYRPWGTISVEGWWQGQYEKGHVLIYLSHILPGQITCYCPRKMLLPRRQITRRKLCFYYKCKFGVISINYVIIID